MERGLLSSWLKKRLDEAGLLGSTTLREVIPPKPAGEIGPFEIEFISGPTARWIAWRWRFCTPLGSVIHTGDFKIDQPRGRRASRYALFRQVWGLRRAGGFRDSTNVERPDLPPSERAIVRESKNCAGPARRVILSCFASSILAFSKYRHRVRRRGTGNRVRRARMVDNVELRTR